MPRTDIGTGPGKVVFDLLPNFKHAIGLDPSAAMVEQAQKDASRRGFAEGTTFIQSAGETCHEALSSMEHVPADVITAAMSAHWMRMPAFYAAAAKALRSGGTLAIWTCSSLYAHPSTPNATVVQEALTDCEDNFLKPYHHSFIALTRGGYATLELPWSSEPPVPEFRESDFRRMEWDVNGIPSAPPLPDGSPGSFLMGNRKVKVKELEKGLGSSSSVVRFRDQNPKKAYTEEDPVVWTGRRISDALGGEEELVVSPSVHLLLMRKV